MDKLDYIETRVDLSSGLMDILGNLMEVTILQIAQKADPEDTTVRTIVETLVKEARPIKKEDVLHRLSYDVEYTEDGDRAPQLFAYFRRPKSEADRLSEESVKRADIDSMLRLASKHGLKMCLLDNTGNGLLRNIQVHGVPCETGTYIIWEQGAGDATYPGVPRTLFFESDEGRWYLDQSKKDMWPGDKQLKYDTYQGPLPKQIG